MPTHRRGRSLSEALTLEESEEDGLVISSFNSASNIQDLKEGDEILGATINFDHLSKDEVLKVLKMMEPYDDNIQVYTRKNLNRSLDSLNQSARTPEAMLNDSYNKLYNAKIKKFVKSDSSGAEASSDIKMSLEESKTGHKSDHFNVDAPSGSFTLPRFGINKTPQFKGGISASDENLISTNMKETDLTTDTPVYIKGPSGKYKAPKFTMPTFNLPNIQVPDLNGDIDLPDTNLTGPSTNLKISSSPKNVKMSTGLSLKTPNIKGGMKTPDLDMPNSKMKNPKIDVNKPDVSIGSPKAKLKLPKIKIPKFSYPGMTGPEINGNINAPDFNVNAPNVNLKGPKADLDMNLPDLSGEFKKPNLNLPDLGVSGPELDGPNLGLKTPDLDISAPKL
ncbi:neuroblast differentiation-associated protein AHNAK, partial [Nematolebias whitei]|uniref:neuroblast differentiation-associated protein AHNAK n=1 Tax=Nematolebias whitei TaxID=451745 RepID=UPI001899230B